MRGILHHLVRYGILVCLGILLSIGIIPTLTHPHVSAQSVEQLPSQSADSLAEQGRLFYEQGKWEEAISTWKDATQLYRTLDDSVGITDSLINQTNALTLGGHYRQACEITLLAIGLADPDCNFSEPATMTEVMTVLKTESDPTIRLLKVTTLGNVLRLNGYLPQAQALLAAAVPQAQTLDQPELYAKTLLSLGKVQQLRYQRIIQLYTQTQAPQDQREAVDLALDALAVYQAAARLSTEPLLQVQITAQCLDLLTHLQRRITLFNSDHQEKLRTIIPQIQTQFQTAQAFNLKNLPPSRTLIDSQLSLAQSLITLWALPEVTQTINISPAHILSWVHRAQGVAIALQDTAVESQTLGTLGHFYEVWDQQTFPRVEQSNHRSEHWQQAQISTQAALDLAQSLQASHLAYQWSWQLGRLYRDQPDVALPYYQTTVDTLENVRRNLLTFNPEVRFDLRETIEPLYQEFVLLLLEQSATTPSQANLQQAIREIDELQLAQLEDFLSCDLTPQLALHEEPADSTAAIIYPILLPDQLDIVVKFPNTETLQFYRTPLTKPELMQTLHGLRQQVELPYFTQEFFEQSQQVYDWLIRPMEMALTDRSIETLVFVADGALGNVPMAVLHDGQQFLIEKYAVALTPSLRLSAAQPLSDTDLQALAFGLSETRPDFPPHQGFAPLENVETELTIIQDQLLSQNYLNQRFTSDLLQTLVRDQPSPVVHLATHGQFSSDPDNTFLLAWDQRITLDDVRQLLGNRTDQPPIELLVLSACETATGDSQATMGLAGVAVQSGARSTIASLWAVDDIATTELMGYLYQALSAPSNRDTLTRAQALRQAQLALLNNPNFRAPTYWSAFVLVGNWL